MKSWILKLLVEWLVSNLDQEAVKEVMDKYVLPFLKDQKATLYKWLDDLAASNDEEWDDVLVQVVKFFFDALLPK